MKKEQLVWKCRRGMKEMDIMFLSYLNQYYDQADITKQAAFQMICDLPDVEIMDYLFERAIPDDPVITQVLSDMKAAQRLAKS